MAQLKTKRNDKDPIAFIRAVENDTRMKDSMAVLAMMQELTGAPPKMWGDSIVGIGTMAYTNTRGTNGDRLLAEKA